MLLLVDWWYSQGYSLQKKLPVSNGKGPAPGLRDYEPRKIARSTIAFQVVSSASEVGLADGLYECWFPARSESGMESGVIGLR